MRKGGLLIISILVMFGLRSQGLDSALFKTDLKPSVFINEPDSIASDSVSINLLLLSKLGETVQYHLGNYSNFKVIMKNSDENVEIIALQSQENNKLILHIEKSKIPTSKFQLLGFFNSRFYDDAFVLKLNKGNIYWKKSSSTSILEK